MARETTSAHVHSVQGIVFCFFFKHPSNLTYNWFCIWYMIPKLSIFMPISGGLSCQVITSSDIIDNRSILSALIIDIGVSTLQK